MNMELPLYLLMINLKGFEPNSAPFLDRIKSLEFLHKKDLKHG